MIEFVVIFAVGILAGIAISLGYGMYQLRKINNAKEDLLKKLKSKAEEIRKQTFDVEEKKESIRARLFEAVKLAEEQMELRAQAEMPSKNSLHSRHQNGLIYKINELEKRKIDILRSILKDGFDPTITVLNEGGSREEIPLSAYIARNDGVEESPATPSPNGPRKAGKFVIYKGGKDDGETTH